VPRNTYIKLLVLVVLAAIFACSLVYFDDLKRLLDDFLTRTRQWGLAGVAVFAGVYVLATVLFLPGLILTLAGGFTFGLLWGTIGVSVGSTIGAAAAFLLGRTLLRDAIERNVSSSPRFAAIDRSVGRHGAKIVLLVRLSPVFPFNLTNYAFGLTNVRFWPYVLASWVGMLPATVMYVYLGSAAKSLAEILAGTYEPGVAQQVLVGIGLVATVVVTVLVTQIARKALRDDVSLAENPPGEAEG
jgi:uncharacterized membrane protein YdjX (TVP38/TMEM64 family)